MNQALLASRGCGQLHPCNARWSLWLSVLTAGTCSGFNGDSTITSKPNEGESEMSEATTRPTEAGLYFAVVKQSAAPGPGEAPYLEIAVLFFGASRGLNLRLRKWAAKEIDFGPKIALEVT
jgi:hypothetical protein